jgi:hypothetical protein
MIVGVKYFALDYGRGKIVLVWGSGDAEYYIYKNLVTLISNIPEGSVLIAEKSMGGYDFNDHNEAIEISKQRRIELRAVSTRAVGKARNRINLKKPRHGKQIEDIIDARLLLQEFGYDGCKRGYGQFFRREKKPLPTNLRDAIKELCVNGRRDTKKSWQHEKEWLKNNRLEQIPVLCSALIVAKYLRQIGETQRTYRKFTRISENGSANGVHRSNGTYWLFPKNSGKYNTLEARKARYREINHAIHKIWKLTGVKETLVTDFMGES